MYADYFALRIKASIQFRLWFSCTYSYQALMKCLALLTLHRKIDPTTFDKWQFVDFQTWYKEFLDAAEEQNKKSSEEQEKTKSEQENRMSSMKHKAMPKMPKSSGMPKMGKSPSMRMPKLK